MTTTIFVCYGTGGPVFSGSSSGGGKIAIICTPIGRVFSSAVVKHLLTSIEA